MFAGTLLLALTLAVSLATDYWQASRQFDAYGMEVAALSGAAMQREEVLFSVAASLLCSQPSIDSAAAALARVPDAGRLGRITLYRLAAPVSVSQPIRCESAAPPEFAPTNLDRGQIGDVMRVLTRGGAAPTDERSPPFHLAQRLALPSADATTVQWVLLELSGRLPIPLGGVDTIRYRLMRHGAMDSGQLTGGSVVPTLNCRFPLSADWDLVMSRGIAYSDIDIRRLELIAAAVLLLLLLGGRALRKLHRRQYQRSLEHDTLMRRAHHDALTGLPNRIHLGRFLEEVLREAVRRDGEVAVLFIDLDGFKEVNDQHGHSVGDELLMLAARRLANALAHGDMVARLGGDEFVVVLPYVRDRASVEAVVARLRRLIEQPYIIGGRRVRIGASLGIALAPSDGTRTNELLAVADAEMYGDKSRRRNFGAVYRFPG